ncbi:MAG: extracellular solute-binding protein [Lachnospiraceae bacterium]|nr:extracellular solute-binding protein [Lachnospiraceae bacterium]
MKNRVLSLLLTGTMVVSLAACDGGNGNGGGQAGGGNEGGGNAEPTQEVTQETFTGTADEIEGGSSSELTDGKFAETRHITVEIYDRGNDGGSDPTNNMYTDYIKKGMLEDHNVEVEFVKVPRWTETDEINNLLAAGTAPDICLTYSYPTIQTYADMGGVIDLQDLVVDNKNDLPHLWDWLGQTNMYWDKSVQDGTLWALEGKRANNNRIVTFIRKDWLDTLGLEEPTTREEFYNCMVAFRDNADTLLGKDAKQMVPFSVSSDVGWRAALLIESFMDPDVTDKELYTLGFDDRKLTQNGTKEAIQLLNQWYNEDLMWKDFAIAESNTEDDMMKAGYVGAFMHNWDYPFRNGEDSINANLQRNVGPDAKFVAIDCWENSKGEYVKYCDSTAGDRKIFFPTTNDEPLASLLYLDWISDPEHIEYLQVGDEGVTHEKTADGAYTFMPATGDAIMNSGQNIDMTITCNGLHLSTDELTLASLANNYPPCDPEDVAKANEVACNGKKPTKNAKITSIEAETGMGEALNGKRDIIYDTCMSCKPEEFEANWEELMADYLSSGGQDIIDERTEKWEAQYGDKVNLD